MSDRHLLRRFLGHTNIILLLAITATLLLAFGSLYAQDEATNAPPAARETAEAGTPPTGEAIDTPSTTEPDSPPRPVVPRATQPQVARKFAPQSVPERFDQGIGHINNIVQTVMFFDMSFGAFTEDKVNVNGKPVFTKKPVFIKAASDMKGYELDSKGDLKLGENGLPLIVDIKAGEEVQKVDAKGNPISVNGPQDKHSNDIPFMVIFLVGGAVLYTFLHGFINIRGFKHAIDVVFGKYTDASDPGDVTPFRALTCALSATVGLGNIAGVAIAVRMGGPGAIFWMMFLGLFGMSAKFHESTLSQMFRITNKDGTVCGGPMFYLDKGLKGKGIGWLGKILAIMFAVFCMGGALGGGNMFQANQAFEGFYEQFAQSDSLAASERKNMIGEGTLVTFVNEEMMLAEMTEEQKNSGEHWLKIRRTLPPERVEQLVTVEMVAASLPQSAIARDKQAEQTRKTNLSMGFGALMAVLVGMVVIGGITRICAATSKIVPTMCGLYVIGCLIVILSNIQEVPSHIGLIFTDAFGIGEDGVNKQSMIGGFIGALIIGFQRAAFSSEAGLGSSAIAHSAAKASYPVREGFVASLEPFVDTIVICFMTAMVVLITDTYKDPALANDGAKITLAAFSKTSLGAWFPYVLSISIILFAFSTQISWCYYGERAYQYLFGLKTVVIFRLVFVACVFIGAVSSLGSVLDFSDLMILSMAFPNIFGGIILAGLVRKQLKDYWAKYKRGELRAGDKNEGADI